MPNALCEAVIRSVGCCAHSRVLDAVVDLHRAGMGEIAMPCDWCGRDRELEVYHGSNLCQECKDDSFICSGCGDAASESYTLPGRRREVYCESCFQNFPICDGCNETFHEDDLDSYENGSYCEGCRNDGTVCDGCNCLLFGNDISYDDDSEEYLCNRCVRDRERSGGAYVHAYGWKPEPQFRQVNPGNLAEGLCFGVEIEVNHPESMRRSEAAKIISDLDRDKLFYMKNDSSIGPTGIEIVSHPMSFQWMKRNPDWLLPISTLSHHKFTSYFGYHCGMHVHMSRRAFTNTQILKVKNYLNKNPSFLLEFGRKKRSMLYDYASPEEGKCFRVRRVDTGYDPYYGTTLRRDWNKLKYRVSNLEFTGHRHIPVNVTENTVEHRWFRGTLSPSAIMRNIEFCHATWGISHNVKEITHKNMYAYLESSRKDYPNALKRFESMKSTSEVLGVI